MPGNIIEPNLSVVAQWPKPNYDDRTGVRRTWLPIFTIVFLVISTVLTFIRVALRARQHGGGFGWDDVVLLPGWLLLLGFSICAIWVSEKGIVDRHIWDLEVYKYEQDALNAWIAQLIFIIGTCCVKISILLFYRRMVTGTFKRRWRWAIWAAIIFTAGYTTVFVFLLLFNCKPTESYWKAFDADYKEEWRCADTKWVNYLAGILAVLSDFYSVCLPAIMLWPLEMPRRQKVGLNAIFASGLITVVAAGFRTNSLIDLGRKYDSSWTGFWVYLWSLLEYNVGIICACAPSLRVFFRKYLKGSLHRSTMSSGSKKILPRTCSKGDEEMDVLPPGEISLRRSLTTVNSETPFAAETDKRRSDVQEEISDVDYHDESSTERSSRRHGMIHVARVYRNEAEEHQTFFESKSTLHDAPAEPASTPPPMPFSSTMAASGYDGSFPGKNRSHNDQDYDERRIASNKI